MTEQTNTTIPPLFENERYTVIVTQVPGPHEKMYRGYGVRNKTTMVDEYFTMQLPDACSVAEQLDLAMQTEQWRWVRDAREVAPDGSSVNELEPEEWH